MHRDELTLDHAALLVRRLDLAAEAFERLGFRLTRRSVHEGQLEPGGPTVVWGTSSRCAMFQDSYLELISASSDTAYGRGVASRAEQREGIHLVALGTNDLAQTYSALAGRLVGLEPPVSVRRAWPVGEGTELALFRMAHLEGQEWPEADLVLVEHRTPDVLWQSGAMEHPNTAIALSFIVIASNDPRRSRQRLGRLIGNPVGPVLKLKRGRLSITDPVGLTRRYPGAAATGAPFPAALGIRVRDLEAARDILASNRVPHLRSPNNSIWVGPMQAGGAVVEFVEDQPVR
ncbi:MAG TPA: VOC family protein [Geminicoccus sp.]|jgi:catechol 2,3-dioxygenase-like lactoylglutathione lyase family enzyme|uniref:VOC family protein n=1 Tax=Geminicoccus sp. TaxID=2024832 RepID=UPI002E31EA77|nr:VOC family protein [Geminicoccus sp.]HEX2526466.1 VOC family protein [Geminicoccus sp.]